MTKKSRRDHLIKDVVFAILVVICSASFGLSFDQWKGKISGSPYKSLAEDFSRGQPPRIEEFPTLAELKNNGRCMGFLTENVEPETSLDSVTTLDWCFVVMEEEGKLWPIYGPKDQLQSYSQAQLVAIQKARKAQPLMVNTQQTSVAGAVNGTDFVTEYRSINGNLISKTQVKKVLTHNIGFLQ